MAHERLRPEYSFDQEKIDQLKQLAPECFEDGKINFETLRQNLGDWAQDEDDDTIEHFGLSWPGKRDARKLAAMPATGTLEPVYGEGLKPDGTPDTDGKNDSKNIFIEGENLEVLRILQKSYANRIKMIYIDPPYNTGNDFVYDDDFTEPVQEYLRRTGQVDEEGKPLTTNKRSDGRFHSKWLTMMYPRLRLARNLLKEDGVIFVSIDDNEVHNLRAIMNEIFGEENFIAELVWKSRQNKDNRNVTSASIDHEYVICFGKKLRGSSRDRTQYKNPDNDSRGDWASANMVGLLPENLRPNCHYDLINPESKVNYGKPKMGWRYDQNTMQKLIKENKILWPASSDGRPRRKKFFSELNQKYTGFSTVIGKGIYTKDGTEDLENLFEDKVFDFPKPVNLLSILIEQGAGDVDDKDEIILDFFGGSASTAHSLIVSNIQNKFNRKFVIVQLPEEIESGHPAKKMKLNTISEIARERIKRVIKKEDCKDGFSLFKLFGTNYKTWQNVESSSVENLQKALEFHSESPLQKDWNVPKLLTETLLIEGFPLDSTIEKEKLEGNTIHTVTHDSLETSLKICLDDKINEKLIATLDLKNNVTFICLDSAISNQDKLRLSDKGFIKTI
ncbi:site-specific DNA-methyltransferase [Croceibacter atlanticus]|uniref:site-specific DNA-methyltransferase n=1 Tax=Croceibacter atlanticus TaxID=313588 RepID=UPI0030DAA340|tara:strand:+ start:37297 stop:39147 length:1851 start_codon:yes stop_codon:yes gene_type:complete